MTEHLILLRGLTRGNGHWGDFPGKLKSALPNFEIELMEIPGNGTRSIDLTPTNPIEVIEYIKKYSASFKKTKQLHLCGISLGGMIGLKWAEAFPNDLKSLIIINSSLNQLSPFYERLRPTSYVKVLSALIGQNSQQREELILKLTSNNFFETKKYLNQFSIFSEQNPFQRINFFRQLLLAHRIQLSAPPKIPIAVIYSQNDRLVQCKCSEKISNWLKVSSYIHPTAGHDLPLDDPDWLIEKFKITLC